MEVETLHAIQKDVLGRARVWSMALLSRESGREKIKCKLTNSGRMQVACQRIGIFPC